MKGVLSSVLRVRAYGSVLGYPFLTGRLTGCRAADLRNLLIFESST